MSAEPQRREIPNDDGGADTLDELSAPLLHPSPRGLTGLAFAIVVVPFAIILGRLMFASGQHLYLPDDLALIDLHTRRALEWRQQLGVFDHNEWNHPGPALFYALSVPYRVLGSGAKAMFVGATLINALAAVGCVGLVRRRTTPGRALWAAVWLCVLAIILSAVGPAATTYSEGALGALVSPWNPMVVIFPLLLFVLLCAGAVDRSGLSVLGSLLVGSFVIQADFSTLPLVTALFVLSAGAWGVTVYRDRRMDAAGPAKDLGRGWIWVAAGAVVFVLMWLPPVIEQLTRQPGNFRAIYHFFTGGHPGHSLSSGINAVAAGFGVLVVGPAEIMNSFLGNAPKHVGLTDAVSVVIVVIGIAVVAVGIRQRNRFAVGLGGLGLAGTVTAVVAVTRVVGPVYGYLVIWSIVLPVAILIGAGMVRTTPVLSVAGRRLPTNSPVARYTLCGLGVVACVVFGIRVAAIPPLSKVSNTQVEELTAMVTPKLGNGGPVFVGDSGAGSATTRILDVEEFIGLVNQLDVAGYQPKVNQLWKSEFGPGYLATGNEGRSIDLSTWTSTSDQAPGYVGRVGDIAVAVTGVGSGSRSVATGSAATSGGV
jgi:hypothetical protein